MIGGLHDVQVPAGAQAQAILVLWHWLLPICVLVFVAVLVALGLALRRAPRVAEDASPDVSSLFEREPKVARAVWIAVAASTILLLALLAASVFTDRAIAQLPLANALHIELTGYQWWWAARYDDADASRIFTTANELHVPVGRPVIVSLAGADVIHSFWVPRLGGKTDMIPGRRNFMRLQADAPGTYGGQCAEYCGGPHALMGLVVVAHAPDDYAAWLARQSRPAAVVPSAQGPLALIEQGRNVFAASGCAACHTIRGTEANGLAGPDLTHVGSRQTLGAGILPNNQGTMAGWISDSQSLKPGNRMPSYAVLSGQDVRAVAAYLESLK